MRKHSDRPLNTPSKEAHSRCVQRLHSCVFALLYSALAHHQLSPDCPKTSSPSTLDDLPEHGYGRSKTFKSLPLSSTAARFNALYQKRPPCSFRASSREALPAGASDTTLSITTINRPSETLFRVVRRAAGKHTASV